MKDFLDHSDLSTLAFVRAQNRVKMAQEIVLVDGFLVAQNQGRRLPLETVRGTR